MLLHIKKDLLHKYGAGVNKNVRSLIKNIINSNFLRVYILVSQHMSQPCPK